MHSLCWEDRLCILRRYGYSLKSDRCYLHDSSLGGSNGEGRGEGGLRVYRVLYSILFEMLNVALCARVSLSCSGLERWSLPLSVSCVCLVMLAPYIGTGVVLEKSYLCG